MLILRDYNNLDPQTCQRYKKKSKSATLCHNIIRKIVITISEKKIERTVGLIPQTKDEFNN